MKNYKWTWIYGLLIIVLLYMVEQQWMLSYITKTLIKIPLFTLIPWLITKSILKDAPKDHFNTEALKMVFLGMLIVIVGVTGGYFIARPWIEVEAIRADFITRMDISTQLLVVLALYTTFINAFVEEYFFRKFLFRVSLLRGKRITAYLISSMLFSLYHVTIFMQWFTLPVLVLATTGLFIGGLIFAWFAEKSGSILGSWLVHVAADAIIMVLGLVVLGLYK